jgi:hypothetical protein
MCSGYQAASGGKIPLKNELPEICIQKNWQQY